MKTEIEIADAKVDFFTGNPKRDRTDLDREAQCHVVSLTYHAEIKTGTFKLGPGNCTDMDGAIRIFERIDPDVRFIVDGNTIWLRSKGDKWDSRHIKNPDTYEKHFLDYCNDCCTLAVELNLTDADICDAICISVFEVFPLEINNDTRRLFPILDEQLKSKQQGDE